MAENYNINFKREDRANYTHPVGCSICPDKVESGDYLSIYFGNNNGPIVFTEINLLIHQFDDENNQLGKIEKVVTLDDTEFVNEEKSIIVYQVKGMDSKATHGVITFKGYVDEEGLVHKLNKDYCYALADHVKAEYEAFKRGEYVKFNYLESEPKTLVGVDLINSSPKEKQEATPKKEKSPIEELSEEEKQRRIDAILNGFNPDEEPERKVSKERETKPVEIVEDNENDINDLPEHYPKSVLVPPIIAGAVSFFLITVLVLVDKFVLNGHLLDNSSEYKTFFTLTIICWISSGLGLIFSIIMLFINPRSNFAKIMDRPINQRYLEKIGGTKQYARQLIRFARTSCVLRIVLSALMFFIMFTFFLVFNTSGTNFR